MLVAWLKFSERVELESEKKFPLSQTDCRAIPPGD